MGSSTRRGFLRYALGSGAVALTSGSWREAVAGPRLESKMRFGLVTYLWGQDWDLSTLLRNCERSGVLGVELRTTHAHGVEPSLTAEERRAVRQRFEDGPVELVGLGSDERFDHPDEKALARAIETTKAFLKLSRDCGGSGVKVKPDSFHPGVPHQQTIEQIGRSLNTLGAFALDHGQEVRLEVHGQCSPLPIIRQILDVATHQSVRVCWNCNAADIEGEGLEHNFALVQSRFGKTLHVRELEDESYPYRRLTDLLVATDYDGWVLLEARGKPADRVQALIEQRELWEKMVTSSQAGG